VEQLLENLNGHLFLPVWRQAGRKFFQSFLEIFFVNSQQKMEGLHVCILGKCLCCHFVFPVAYT